MWSRAYGRAREQWARLRRSPIYGWTNKQGVRMAGACAVFLAIWTALRFILGDKNEAILVATAAILLWYTMETWSLRWETINQTREMRAQRELQIRPFVVLDFERTESFSIHLALRNVGHGAALGVFCSLLRVQIDPFSLKESKEEEDCERIDVLAGQESRRLISRHFTTGEPYPIEGLAAETFEAIITYKNIEGRAYKLHLRFGPDGYQVLEP